jgi:hypothetical protein
VRLLGGACRNEQPSAQYRAAIGAELDISPLDHRITACCARGSVELSEGM